ncbi:hypothetical protein [Eubacterium maltosivorans]|nr:hypothetical protein [Eubacterium maltosivorans]
MSSAPTSSSGISASATAPSAAPGHSWRLPAACATSLLSKTAGASTP